MPTTHRQYYNIHSVNMPTWHALTTAITRVEVRTGIVPSAACPLTCPHPGQTEKIQVFDLRRQTKRIKCRTHGSLLQE